MGTVASHFVFPASSVIGTNNTNNSIKLLSKYSNNTIYNIPYVHIRHNNARAIIFYNHGNAENLLTISEYLGELSDTMRVDVVSWDFAGYGVHQDLDHVKPNEENVYEDAQCVFEYVKTRQLPIIIWGRSLGSAPAIHTAVLNQNDVVGLVVESGFRSIARIVSWKLHNLWDLFDNEKYIQKNITVPTLFVHGKQDTVVPFDHGKTLFEKCKCEKKEHFWIEHGSHNNLESSYRKEICIRLEGFFRTIL